MKDRAFSLAGKFRIRPGVHLRDSRKCSELSRNSYPVLCLLHVMKWACQATATGWVMLPDNSDISRVLKKSFSRDTARLPSVKCHAGER